MSNSSEAMESDTIFLDGIDSDMKGELFFDPLPDLVALVHIPKTMKNEFALKILKLLFFSENNSFMSYTESTNEISIFINQNLIADIDFQSHGVPCEHNYRVFQIYENVHKINQSGIVQNISTLLASQDIPILYVNSYNNNFILVHKDNFEKAQQLFKDNL